MEEGLKMWSYKKCPSGFWAVFFDGKLWNGALQDEVSCLRLIEDMQRCTRRGKR